jgi:hypothetical protein
MAINTRARQRLFGRRAVNLRLIRHQTQLFFISNMYPKQGKMSAIKLSDASILDKLSVNPWIP